MRYLKLIWLLAALLLLSSCRFDCDRNPRPRVRTCDDCGVTATVRVHLRCGTPPPPDPLPMNFELADGTILEVSNPEFLRGRNLQEGDVVKICFDEINVRPSNSLAAGGDDEQNRTVKLNCVQLLRRGATPEETCRLLLKSRTPDGMPLRVENAWVEGQNIKLAVGYSGCGRRPQDFQLYWTGDVMESMPVQTSLLLRDNLDGATCDMYVTDTLCFDVTPLHEINEREVILRLNDRDFPDNGTPLRVSYRRP